MIMKESPIQLVMERSRDKLINDSSGVKLETEKLALIGTPACVTTPDGHNITRLIACDTSQNPVCRQEDCMASEESPSHALKGMKHPGQHALAHSHALQEHAHGESQSIL